MGSEIVSVTSLTAIADACGQMLGVLGVLLEQPPDVSDCGDWSDIGKA